MDNMKLASELKRSKAKSKVRDAFKSVTVNHYHNHNGGWTGHHSGYGDNGGRNSARAHAFVDEQKSGYHNGGFGADNGNSNFDHHRNSDQHNHNDNDRKYQGRRTNDGQRNNSGYGRMNSGKDRYHQSGRGFDAGGNVQPYSAYGMVGNNFFDARLNESLAAQFNIVALQNQLRLNAMRFNSLRLAPSVSSTAVSSAQPLNLQYAHQPMPTLEPQPNPEPKLEPKLEQKSQPEPKPEPRHGTVKRARVCECDVINLVSDDDEEEDDVHDVSMKQ